VNPFAVAAAGFSGTGGVPGHSPFRGRQIDTPMKNEPPLAQATPGPDANGPAISAAFTLSPEIAAVLEIAPAKVRRCFAQRHRAVAALDSAPRGQKVKTARIWARKIGVRWRSIFVLRWYFRKRGSVALLNRRQWVRLWTRKTAPGLPEEFIEFLRVLSEQGLTRPEVTRLLSARLAAWRNDDKRAAVPGYTTAPEGTPPRGWTPRNLARIVPAIPRAVVTVELRSDGTTRIVRGKLSNVARHPLFDAVRATKGGGNA
jgi:hypothetical protein